MRSLRSTARSLAHRLGITGSGAPRDLKFAGYRIPSELVRLTGGGPETFEEISGIHMRQIEAFAPLVPTHRVLEIGCGIGRDAIPLTALIRPPGRYVGTDVIAASIDWCRTNITPRASHFQFLHFDVRDDLHNPTGTLDNIQISLPGNDGDFDRVIAQSVFTHMFEDEIVHYLREMRRTMAPGAVGLVSFFITDDAIVRAGHGAGAIIDILVPWNTDGCYIGDESKPRGAVAFTSEALGRMLERAGVNATIHYGDWSGQRSDVHALCGQDIAVITGA